MNARSTALDASAIALSVLCLIHCLALPVLSVVLPLLGTLAEAEWFHRLLVILSLPIPLAAIALDKDTNGRSEFTVLSVFALSLLLAASFVKALEDSETLLTVAGAGLLALAHTRRWSRRHRG